MGTNTCIFLLVFFGITVVSLPPETVSDGITAYPASACSRSIILKDEIHSLCSHINQITLPTANTFQTLIRNAHIICPNYQEMTPMLRYMENTASKHRSFVEEQLKGCHELLGMMTNRFENDYMGICSSQSENYSLVTNVIEKWEQSLTKFSATFHLTGTSVQTMLDNSEVFYYDSRIGTFGWFLIKSMMLILVTTIVTLIFTWISSVSNFGATLYCKATQQLFKGYNVLRANWFENRTRTSIVEPITITLSAFYAIVGVLIWIFVFCTLLAAALLWNSAAFSYSTSIRHNWYPDATSTLVRMNTDMEYLHSKITGQIDSINELLFYVSTHHNRAAQAVVDEFVHILVDAFQQVNRELSNAYSLSEKMPARFRRTYKHIEENAMKVGKLKEAYGLLVEVNITANRFEALQSSLAITTGYQQTMLSSLIEQAKSMRILVKQNRLIELRDVIKNYQDALMNIDGSIYKVEIAVNEVIELVDSRQLCGLKITAASLMRTSVYDQMKTIVLGATKSVVGIAVGMRTIRTGHTMAVIAPSITRGPALAITGGLGMIAFGAYGGVSHFDDYIESSQFKGALAVLEIERANLEIAMEKLKKAIGDQRTASKSSQSSLNTLAKYYGLLP